MNDQSIPQWPYNYAVGQPVQNGNMATGAGSLPFHPSFFQAPAAAPAFVQMPAAAYTLPPAPVPQPVAMYLVPPQQGQLPAFSSSNREPSSSWKRGRAGRRRFQNFKVKSDEKQAHLVGQVKLLKTELNQVKAEVVAMKAAFETLNQDYQRFYLEFKQAIKPTSQEAAQSLQSTV